MSFSLCMVISARIRGRDCYKSASFPHGTAVALASNDTRCREAKENERNNQRSKNRGNLQKRRDPVHRGYPVCAEQSAERTARPGVRPDHPRIHRQLAAGIGLDTTENFSGRNKMNATTNEATLTGIGAVVDQESLSDAMRSAQYNMLKEVPGAIFGILTVVYIVSSLFALAH